MTSLDERLEIVEIRLIVSPCRSRWARQGLVSPTMSWAITTLHTPFPCSLARKRCEEIGMFWERGLAAPQPMSIAGGRTQSRHALRHLPR